LDTKQKWVVYVPYTQELIELFSIWKKIPSLANKRLVAGWILSCTNLEFTEDVIIAANFDHSKLRERVVAELVQTIHDKAIKLQSVARRYLAKKYIAHLHNADGRGGVVGGRGKGGGRSYHNLALTSSDNQYDDLLITARPHHDNSISRSLSQKKKKTKKSQSPSPLGKLHYGSSLEERSLSSMSSGGEEDEEDDGYSSSLHERRSDYSLKQGSKRNHISKSKHGAGTGPPKKKNPRGKVNKKKGKDKFQRRLDDIIATYSGELLAGNGNMWTNSVDSLDFDSKFSSSNRASTHPFSTSSASLGGKVSTGAVSGGGSGRYSKTSSHSLQQLQQQQQEPQLSDYDSDDCLTQRNVEKRNDLVMDELKNVRSEINNALAHFQLELSFLRTGLQSHIETVSVSAVSPTRPEPQPQVLTAPLATADADAAVDTVSATAGASQEEKSSLAPPTPADPQTTGLIAKYEDEMSELRNEMKNMLSKMLSLQQQVESYSSSPPPAPATPVDPPAAATASQRTTIRVPRKEIIPILNLPSESSSQNSSKESEGWQSQLNLNNGSSSSSQSELFPPINQRATLLQKRTQAEAQGQGQGSQEVLKVPSKPRQSMNAGSAPPPFEPKVTRSRPEEQTSAQGSQEPLKVPSKPRQSMNAGSTVSNKQVVLAPASPSAADSVTQADARSFIAGYFDLPDSTTTPAAAASSVTQTNDLNTKSLSTKNLSPSSPPPSIERKKTREVSFRLTEPSQKKEVESWEILQKISESANNPKLEKELREKEHNLILEQQRNDALVILKRVILKYSKKRKLKNSKTENSVGVSGATSTVTSPGKFYDISVLELIRKTRDPSVLKMSLSQAYDADRPDLASAALSRICTVFSKIYKGSNGSSSESITEDLDMKAFLSGLKIVFPDYKILTLLMKRYLSNQTLTFHMINILGMLLSLAKTDDLIDSLGTDGVCNGLIGLLANYSGNDHEGCIKGMILCCHLLMDSERNKHRFSTLESFNYIAMMIEKYSYIPSSSSTSSPPGSSSASVSASASLDMTKRTLQLINVVSDGSPMILDMISESTIPDCLMKALQYQVNGGVLSTSDGTSDGTSAAPNEVKDMDMEEKGKEGKQDKGKGKEKEDNENRKVNLEFVKIFCKAILFLCSNNHLKNQLRFGTFKNLTLLFDCLVKYRTESEATVKQCSMTIMGIISQNHELMSQVPVESICNTMKIFFEDETCSGTVVVIGITIIFNFAIDEKIRLLFLEKGIEKMLLKLLEKEKMKPFIDKIRKCLRRLLPKRSTSSKNLNTAATGENSGTSSSSSGASSSANSGVTAEQKIYQSQRSGKPIVPTPPSSSPSPSSSSSSSSSSKSSSRRSPRRDYSSSSSSSRSQRLERIDSVETTATENEIDAASTTTPTTSPTAAASSIAQTRTQQLSENETKSLKQIHQEDIQLKLRNLLFKAFRLKQEKTSLSLKAVIYLKSISTTRDISILMNAMRVCVELSHAELALLTIQRMNLLIKEAKQKRENSKLAIALVESPKLLIDFLFVYTSPSPPTRNTSNNSPPPPTQTSYSTEILSHGFELLTHLTFAVGSPERFAKVGVFQLIYFLLLKYNQPQHEKLCIYILVCSLRLTAKVQIAKIRGGMIQGQEILIKLIRQGQGQQGQGEGEGQGPQSFRMSQSMLEKILKLLTNCVENILICQENFSKVNGHEAILPLFIQYYPPNTATATAATGTGTSTSSDLRRQSTSGPSGSPSVLELLCKLVNNLISLHSQANVLNFGQKSSLRIYLQAMKMNYSNLKLYQSLITLVCNIYLTPSHISYFLHQDSAAATRTAGAGAAAEGAVREGRGGKGKVMKGSDFNPLIELRFEDLFIDLLSIPQRVLSPAAAAQAAGTEILLATFGFIDSFLQNGIFHQILTASEPRQKLQKVLERYQEPSLYEDSVAEFSRKLVSQLQSQ
jgi:hypothetical protein